MNTVTTNINPVQTDPCRAFGNDGLRALAPITSSTAATTVGTFNFNLQPYKFAAVEAVKNGPEIGLDKRTELNRFIAFGKSLALPGAQTNGWY